MNQALWVAKTGLDAQQTRLSVISNNLAALSETISLTNEILTVLEDNDFAAIAELDDRRQPLIIKAFSESIGQID